MAMVTARTEPQYHLLGFSHQLVPLNINSTMKLDTVVQVVSSVSGMFSKVVACLLACLFAGKEAFKFCPSIPLGSLELGFWFSLRYGRLTINQFHDHVQ